MTASLKKRDYKSFGPVAKVRFRPMCEALGFEQTTATVFNRRQNEWYDFVALETSQWGGNGFTIYYGIRRDKSEHSLYEGLSKSLKRSGGKPTKWNRFTKVDIQNSAKEAHEMFIEQAAPFLASFQSKKDVGLAYLNGISYGLEKQLNGELPRNNGFIDSASEFMNWAGMEDISSQIQNGTYQKAKQKSFFKKWFLRK